MDRGYKWVKFLLEHGADPNKLSSEYTPFMVSIKDEDVFELMFEHGGDINIRSTNNKNLFYLFSKTEDSKKFRFSTGSGIRKKFRIKWLKKLVEMGSDINTIDFNTCNDTAKKYFETYEFQQTFIERHPESITMLKPIINDKIEDEYSDLFNSEELGLL